jgi:cyclase
MNVKEIGKRGLLFTFYELDNYPTNVFVINGKTHVFICDTFLGPEPMEEIKNYLRYHHVENPYIIFNSHSHWDHIWGNCAFESSLIVSHVLCRDIIMKEAESELERYQEYNQGNVRIILPNVTFKERISFPEEGIELFYSPGHTVDSASLLDRIDNTLFVGDNIEAPIPYLFYKNLTEYTHTLQTYITMEADTIIPGHGTIPDESLLKENLEYVEAFIRADTEKYEKGKYQHLHRMNVRIQEEMK